MIVVCGKGVGHALHVWNLNASSEMPLLGAEFGLASGGFGREADTGPSRGVTQ
jgi:hypothetical protein